MSSDPPQTPKRHAPGHPASYSPKVRTDALSSPKSLGAATDTAHTYLVARKSKCQDTQELVSNKVAGVDKHLGLHLLGLSRWNNTSVTNLTDVLTETKPALIEITFVPFWGSDPFGHIKTIINTLIKADASGVPQTKCIVTAYLSFHGGYNKHPNDSKDPLVRGLGLLDSLKKRAKHFSDELLVAYSTIPNVSFVLSASLEDEWQTPDFVTYTGEMARHLDWDHIGSLSLRRSGSKSGLKSALKVTRKNPDGNCVDHTFPLQSEYHGYLHGAHGYTAFSNDGFPIYLDKPGDDAHDAHQETTTTAQALPGHKANSLSGLIAAIKSPEKESPNTYLLWRSMYNLWHRNLNKTPSFYEILEKHERTWNLTDNEKANKGPAFDATEQEVVRQFLKAI